MKGLTVDDLPKPAEYSYMSAKSPEFAPWTKPPKNGYHYLAQEPPQLKPDAPILIYMHCAGGDRTEGMGLAKTYPIVINAWLRLRKELLDRGWIYVCPDDWEFEDLQKDLEKRYGKRTIYLMGASWGGKDVFLQARLKLAQDPKAYGGVALLAAMIDEGWPGFAGDKGPGTVTAKEFPVPVYMAVGTGEMKLGGAMYKLYQRLRDTGGTVQMDTYQGAGHPPVLNMDWKRMLDQISGKVTGDHQLTQWVYVNKTATPEMIDPLPSVAPPPRQLLVPEPSLRHAQGGVNYWFTESLIPYPKQTPMEIVVPDTDDNYFEAVGRVGKIMSQKITALGPELGKKKMTEVFKYYSTVDKERQDCLNDGWPYIIPEPCTAEALLPALTSETGARDMHIIGLANGGNMAMDLATAGGARTLSLTLLRPDAQLISKLAPLACPVVITTVSAATAGTIDAARAFLAAREKKNLPTLWISDQGDAVSPSTILLDFSEVRKQLSAGGARQLRCVVADITKGPAKLEPVEKTNSPAPDHP